MKKQYAEFPLVRLLQAKAHLENLTVLQLGERLGISQSYLSQLLSGDKSLEAVRDSFLRACAEYLGLPVVHAYLLAHRLKPSDFYVSQNQFLAHLNDALEIVAKSKFAHESASDISELKSLQDSIKLMIVLLFEEAEGVRLLPARFNEGHRETASGAYRAPFDVRINTTK